MGGSLTNELSSFTSLNDQFPQESVAIDSAPTRQYAVFTSSDFLPSTSTRSEISTHIYMYAAVYIVRVWVVL